MIKRISIFLVLFSIGLFFFLRKNPASLNESSNVENDSSFTAKINSKKEALKEVFIETKKDEESESKHIHNSVHNKNLKIEDFLIELENTNEVDSLKSIFQEASKIELERTTIAKVKDAFSSIDIQTEVTANQNPDTGSMYFIKSTSNIPGTRYVHAQILGEGKEKFVQHLSFEYKGQGKSFNEAVTVAQSMVGSDQKPAIISENYMQWKISESHILWVKKLTKDELLNDPIYPHSEEDLGTIKIAIEQEIH